MKNKLDKWNDYFNEYGYKLVEKNRINAVWIITAFVIGLTFSGVIFYGISNDKFKSTNNQEVILEPNISNEINNEYVFSPDNKYSFNPNYSIYVNNILECP